MPSAPDSGRQDPHPRDVLRAHGLAPRKAAGQNFLVAGADLDRVAEAARLCADDVALEIGTGLGRLTVRLAERCTGVVSVEIDRGLHALARERLRECANVTLLCADFLESKHAVDPAVTEAVRAARRQAPGELRVASNLPYGISSPAVVNLLEWGLEPAEMCLMLQAEVADRLVAEPGTSEYGPLTVYVDYWATVERLFRLPPQAFWPPPKVSSALVRVRRRPGRAMTEEYGAFAATVRELFTYRRKTLARALRLGWGRAVAGEVPEAVGMEGRARVEQLTTAQFEAIARAAGPPAQS
jgi:16S rRNA (adenine1518-N6/adenine1519-N6)-dimethyltransferase